VINLILLILTAAFVPGPDWRDITPAPDLKGWRSSGRAKSSWTVRGGVLCGKWRLWNVLYAGGWIWSEAVYSDFDLRLEYCINPGGNSGVAVRWPRDAGSRPSQSGYEVQIMDRSEAEYPTGSIYGLVRAPGGLSRPGEWNRMLIRGQGQTISVWLNGTKAAELSHSGPLRGRIGFQVHDPFSKPRFRNIQIRPAPDNRPPEAKNRGNSPH